MMGFGRGIIGVGRGKMVTVEVRVLVDVLIVVLEGLEVAYERVREREKLAVVCGLPVAVG